MQQVGNLILNYGSDKRFKTFKEGLMHPGLALVAELRGTLGDFPSLGS